MISLNGKQIWSQQIEAGVRLSWHFGNAVAHIQNQLRKSYFYYYFFSDKFIACFSIPGFQRCEKKRPGSCSRWVKISRLDFITVRVRVRVGVTLRLGVFHQSIGLGANPIEANDQRVSFKLNPCGHSPCVTSFLTRRWVCLLWTCLAFVKCIYRNIACYCKFFLLLSIQVLCQSRLCKADHAYLTYLTLQRQLTHLNGRKLEHCQI
jgi:hypothetical protein